MNRDEAKRQRLLRSQGQAKLRSALVSLFNLLYDDEGETLSCPQRVIYQLDALGTLFSTVAQGWEEYEMSEMAHLPEQTITHILNEATDQTDGQVGYVTNARVKVTNNDVTIDFYHVTSDPHDPETFVATHKNRLVMPLASAKDLGSVLVRLTEKWEESMGVSLPFIPIDVREEFDDGEA